MGVMSLKMMPCFGKSATSRTAARSLAMLSEGMGAMLATSSQTSTAALLGRLAARKI
jgi:hypothetical protein